MAQNTVFPDDKIAMAVLTNQEASAAAGSIARANLALLLPSPAADRRPARRGARPQKRRRSRSSTGLQQGTIDRALFTADCNFYFDQTSLDDHRTSLGPLGAVRR